MSPETIQKTKAELRGRFREIRRELAADQRESNDRSIAAAIEQLCRAENAESVAGYLAFDGEPDIRAALASLSHEKVAIHLPILGAGDSRNPLGFRRWTPRQHESGDPGLKPNAYGINEPVIGELCPVSELDILLIPLVAWDGDGGRLGMGAGYYDRALSEIADAPRPLRIGIAYQAQRGDSIPMTRFDVPLHGVITEKGFFTFTS